MNYIRPRTIAITMAIPLLALVSCKKLPETSFTYLPMENPEAGEFIQFENTTSEASSFEWVFGDGENSSQENPKHIFDDAGNFEVTLTATNDDGSQPKSENITINEATILSFFILDSTEVNLLDQAEVLLYDNQADWDNFEEPLQTAISNENGEAMFSNMEAIVYYIWVIKEETSGFWGSGGSTEAIFQNEINAYTVPCTWYEDEVKKAAVQYPKPLKYMRR